MFRLALILLTLPATFAFSKEFPLFVRAFDFTIKREWSAVHYTDIEVLKTNQWVSNRNGVAYPMTLLKTQKAGFSFPMDVNLSGKPIFSGPSKLSDLQRRALLKMLRDGYITREMFEAVEEGAGIWEPSQLRYFVLWSPVTVSEARVLFKGKIPWDRVMSTTPGAGHRLDKSNADWINQDEVWKWEMLAPPDQVIGISRASLLAASGQVWDEANGKMDYLPLSWEKAPQFSEVAPLDRKLFPLAVEVGRLLSESEPSELKGDLRYPLQVLTRILTTEARLHQVPMERYGTFGWTLAPSRARFDHRMFGIRPYNREVVDRLKENFDSERVRLKELPFPRPAPQETVLYGHLDDIADRFETHYTSFTEFIVTAATQGLISREEARKIYELILSRTFSYFSVKDRFPKQTAPVCLTNMSPFKPAFTAQALADLGVTDDAQGIALLRFYQEVASIQEPNAFSHRWKERGYILINPQYKPDAKEKSPIIFIDNLEEEAAREHPSMLAEILVGIVDSYEREIVEATPLQAQNLSHNVRDLFDPEVSYDRVPDVLVANSWFVIRTTSEFIRDELQRLGGRVYPAFLLFNPTVNVTISPEGSVGFDTNLGDALKAYTIWFRGDEVVKWRRASASRVLGCGEAVSKAFLLQVATEL